MKLLLIPMQCGKSQKTADLLQRVKRKRKQIYPKQCYLSRGSFRMKILAILDFESEIHVESKLMILIQCTL